MRILGLDPGTATTGYGIVDAVDGRLQVVAYGVIKTAEAVSPVIAPHIALSLAAFIISYTFVFGAGSYYILHLIAKGPVSSEEGPYGTHGIKKPPLVTDLMHDKGGEHV